MRDSLGEVSFLPIKSLNRHKARLSQSSEDPMDIDDKQCLVCGERKVEGEVEGVKLTLCCVKCCQKTRGTFNSVYKGRYRISKTKAISTYGCTYEDLMSLNFESLPNPVEPKGPPMKLYLRAEAQYLGNLKRQAEREEKAKRERGAIIGKLRALEMRLGTCLSDMDSMLRHFLLGDYLDKSKDTKTRLDDVIARFSVLDRVKEILNVYPRAHPEAVFGFCLENPKCGPAEFQELKEKVKAVFRLEGFRIFHKLPHPEAHHSLLTKGPLKDVYQEFMNRDARSLVRGYLRKWCSEQTADEIMRHPACQPRLSLGEEEEKTAMKFMEFWTEKDDKNKRTERLKAEFEHRGVAWQNNCKLCEMYINGEIECDAKEIVGIKDVRAQLDEEIEPLMTIGPDGFMIRSRLVEHMYQDKLSYAESVRKTVEETLNSYYRVGLACYDIEEFLFHHIDALSFNGDHLSFGDISMDLESDWDIDYY